MTNETRRAALSDAKRALLERRLRGETGSMPERPTIPRSTLPGPEYPASFAQERMWFLARFDPESPMYNVPVAVLVGADVDVPLLERAWSEVVRRHESLRTSFHMGADGQLRQIVHEPRPLKIEVRDVRDRVGDRFADDVSALVAEEGSFPFDLEQPPLFRVTLLRVSDRDFAMVTTMHHIVTDGWAYPLMNREVVELYDAFGEGRPSPLPEPLLRYVDFSAWQREYLSGERLESQVAFWRERLVGAPPVELPTDRPRPAVESHRGGFHRFRFDSALEERLRDLCRTEAATLNMVLMAGFYALLRRYTGQDDLTVGTLLGNRPRAEMEEIVGVFVNTAALRVDVSGDPPLRELIARAKRAVLDADRNQDLPFEKLVDELGVPRDLSRHPVFQILYFHHVYVRSHREGTTGPLRFSLQMRPVHPDHDTDLLDTGVAKFDLMVATVETAAGLGGVFEYASDLFDAGTVERMAAAYRTLLDAASRAPDVPVSELPLVSDQERHTLLESWGAGPAPHAPAAAAHVRVAARAGEDPDAPALVRGTDRVTRGELDTWANMVAHALRERGVGRGSVVGVQTERTPGMVAALLGVWKAGAAYLPLDPGHPPERRAFMAGDAGVRWVLTDGAEVPSGTGAVPLPPRPASGERVEACSVEVGPADAAVVIYTSGSTGTPKGVVVEHGGLASVLDSYAATPGIGEGDSLLAVTTISFDISMAELFAPLVHGARVVLASREEASDGAALARLVAGERITLMQGTPATWRLLVRSGWEGSPDLTALSAGEALGSDLADDLRARTRALWNGYGPTETTIYATLGHVDAAVPGSAFLGRPLPGVRLYVLDESMRSVGVGVPGELFIGGGGVARGYLGRPALTAGTFLPDPFEARPGARMYRTGDRVRWTAAGELAFMGRLDAQVKVRGFRIEPGEVEAALAAHPGLAAAAVAVRRDPAGDAFLAAWVVGKQEAPGAAELRGFLRERLPEYMIPSLFTPVDALPLTASGKVDRRALPEPRSEAAAPVAFVGPRNVVEDSVAEIWGEVLGRSEIGVATSFFELGGHSLSATQVLVRIREAFDVDLPIRTFFTNPTIEGLAAAVQEAGSPVLEGMMADLDDLSDAEIAALLGEA